MTSHVFDVHPLTEMSNSTSVGLSPELEGRVRLGAVFLDGVHVLAKHPHLAADIERYAAELRQQYGTAPSLEVPGTAETRTLYKQLGLDPTKVRPSSEALLRRVLKGEPLYRVNSLVDALNLASLQSQLPFGLYDRAKLVPPIQLRLGGAGAEYEGIRKGTIHVEGRPVLFDQVGPFGNPTSDSARTQITLDTRDVLVILFAPFMLPVERVRTVLDDTRALLMKYCGGTPSQSFVTG